VATDITKNFKGNSQALEVAMGYEKSIQNYYGVGKETSDSLIATYFSIDVPLNLSYSFPRICLNFLPRHHPSSKTEFLSGK